MASSWSHWLMFCNVVNCATYDWHYCNVTGADEITRMKDSKVFLCNCNMTCIQGCTILYGLFNINFLFIYLLMFWFFFLWFPPQYFQLLQTRVTYFRGDKFVVKKLKNFNRVLSDVGRATYSGGPKFSYVHKFCVCV